ncbi:class II aldolase/adducin family protein [Pseudonocardia ailaonensis]|uniref:Class II aldolase/adducin family protein n=1 Tax=Pseudonocardia ailaonensis TaxID=367279 RepID=A0ABN2MPW9_9PSEU
MLLGDERVRIVECCRRMAAAGLTVGTSGNVSERRGELVAVTPTGVDYDRLAPEEVSVVDLVGGSVEGLEPSSELPMHLAVYRATDAAAVVHTHPLHATALSTVADELPGIHYLVMRLGGPVRVAPYARYGSTELAEGSVRALEDRSAVLLRNHGATTYGATLAQAYERAELLEWLCALYHRASQLGTPSILGDAELAEAAAALSDYGQHP